MIIWYNYFMNYKVQIILTLTLCSFYIKFHIRSTKNDGGGTVLLPADDGSLDTIDGKTTVEKDTKGYEMLIIVYDLQSNKYIIS